MRCAHCEAPRAGNRWTIQACADGRKKRSKWLCDPCDVDLNRLVMVFLGDKEAERKCSDYEQKAREARDGNR